MNYNSMKKEGLNRLSGEAAYELGYKDGEREGQARMNNSGRLLYQSGFEAGTAEAIGQIEKYFDNLGFLPSPEVIKHEIRLILTSIRQNGTL